MNHTILENYVHTKKLNIDLNVLKNSCFLMNNIINDSFTDKDATYEGEAAFSTKVFSKYNLLSYPFPGFHNLYTEIKTMLYEIHSSQDTYYIQCWLNYSKNNEFIDWHHHWKFDNSYHGFFCVDTYPSKTTYKLDDNTIFDVISEDNLLIISSSTRDFHRTWPWTEDRPRITIAFDIVPAKYINPTSLKNHWIPI